MTAYRVTWIIDVEKHTALGAALLAYEIMQDDTSIATVFEVTDQKTGVTTTIDLADFLVEDDDEC